MKRLALFLGLTFANPINRYVSSTLSSFWTPYFRHKSGKTLSTKRRISFNTAGPAGTILLSISQTFNPPNGSMGRHGGVRKKKLRVSYAFLALGAIRQISNLESASRRVLSCAQCVIFSASMSNHWAIRRVIGILENWIDSLKGTPLQSTSYSRLIRSKHWMTLKFSWISYEAISDSIWTDC